MLLRYDRYHAQVTNSRDKDVRERRASRIVFDERGQAQVEWLQIPDDRSDLFEHKRLSVTDPSQATKTAKRKPTDLRKLSEWIKARQAAEKNKTER